MTGHENETPTAADPTDTNRPIADAIAALGVGCPLCAVGAPALLGWGAYRRWKVKRFEKAVADESRW